MAHGDAWACVIVAPREDGLACARVAAASPASAQAARDSATVSWVAGSSQTVGDGRVADEVVPGLNGQLTGDHGGTSSVAVVADLENVASLLIATTIR